MKRSIHSTFRVPTKKPAPAAAAPPPGAPPPLAPPLHQDSQTPPLQQPQPFQELFHDGDSKMPATDATTSAAAAAEDKENMPCPPSSANSSSASSSFPIGTKTGFKPPTKRFVPPTSSSSSSSSFVNRGPTPSDPLAAAPATGGGVKHFTAMYTKNTQKKKKTWQEGVLIVEPMAGGNSKVGPSSLPPTLPFFLDPSPPSSLPPSLPLQVSLQNENGKNEARKTIYGGSDDAVKEGDELIMMSMMVRQPLPPSLPPSPSLSPFLAPLINHPLLPTLIS